MLRKRYRRIVFFFARVIFGIILWDLLFPRIGLRFLSRRTRSNRYKRISSAFRGLAVDMGGVLIKVGQFLSTRVDILPTEITNELAGLQDEVPAEEFQAIKHLAEAEFGGSLEDLFASFEENPLAAASLGQVHKAQLHDPQEGFLHVVVKVQRPNIENIINTDLAALRTVGGWVQRYPPIRRRVDVPALLFEFTKVTLQEIDYINEGENAGKFRANFRWHPGVKAPQVVWSHTTRRVLTLEDVYAIKITDYDAIQAAGIPLPDVAQRLFSTYLQQMFEDGFFHADPHPGNLFVDVGEDPDDWLLTFVDFGMMGRISQQTHAGLREMVIGVGTQDPARLIKSYQLLGMLLPSADLQLIEKAEARAFDRFWGKSMGELQQISFSEMHDFAREFRELIYTMPFQVPQDLIWAGRTVAILSGMCTGLDPEFNFWSAITPYAKKLLAQELETGWEFWREELVNQVLAAVRLPRRLDTLLTRAEQGNFTVQSPDQTRQLARIAAAIQRLTRVILFAALLLAGIQLHLGGEGLWAGILFAGAVLALLAALLFRK